MATSRPSSPIRSSDSSPACSGGPNSPQGTSQFSSYHYLLDSIYPTSGSGPYIQPCEVDNMFRTGSSRHLSFLDHVTGLPCTSELSNELPGLLRPFGVDDLKPEERLVTYETASYPTKVKAKAKVTDKPRKPYVRHPKPPYSYLGMIAAAILMSPDQKLTLSEIRNALAQMFPFFTGEYRGWQDSVRHCLSSRDCFYREFHSNRINKWRVDVSEMPHDAFIRKDAAAADVYKYKFHLHEQLGVDAVQLYGGIPTHPLVKAGLVSARMKDADDFLAANQPDDTEVELKHGISAILERTPVSVISDSPFSMETARHEESQDIATSDKISEYGTCRTLATSSSLSPAETSQRDTPGPLPSTSAVTTGYDYHDNDTGIPSETAGHFDMAQSSVTSGPSTFYPGYPACDMSMMGQYESLHYPASHSDYWQYYPNYPNYQTAYVYPENYPYFQHSPHYPGNYMFQHFDSVPDVAHGNGYPQHCYPYGHPGYSYPDHSDSTAIDLCNRKSSPS